MTPVARSSAPVPASSAPPPASVVGEITGTLYAQAIPNGYQVIDTTPKKVLTLLKTSIQDYFIAEAAATNGIVFKKNGEWYFEYYKDNKLISQKLEIKF
jgi:allophanate hydrolase subunit 1